MNILYTNFHVGEGGGHATYILSLLRNPRHNKYVATPPSSLLYRTLEEQGYDKLIPLTFPSRLKHFGAMLKNTRALRRIIQEHDIDIVHTNGSPDNRMALYASFLNPKKFRVIFTKHNTYKVKGAISRFRLNRFNDAVIFVSESVIEEAGLQKGYPRYHVVDHGIDLDYWKRSKPLESGEKIRLVSVAGRALHKGWQHLVEALAGLDEAERRRLSVTLLGRPEQETVDIEARAAELCDFAFPGFFEDPRPWLEEADVGFVLSHREACSFASREMSAMSLPVISSDFPNYIHNIDESCGWVTKRRDPESIRAVLRGILALLPEELNAMKLAARRKAENSFSLQRMIAETDKVYENVMGRASTDSREES